MSRDEQERENLLRDAVAYVTRAEYRPVDAGAIFLGRRANGTLSIYLDQDAAQQQDPVWHFNAQGELRRAFWNGQLYKAEQHQLVKMTRVRTDNETELRAEQLSGDEQAVLLERVRHDITTVITALQTATTQVVGELESVEPCLSVSNQSATSFISPLAAKFGVLLQELIAKPLIIAASPGVN